MSKNKYILKKILGKGTYGTTYLGEDDSGKNVAIKVVSIDSLNSKQDVIINAVIGEIHVFREISKNINGGYVAKYIDSFFIKDDLGTEICIVSEYIEGETLMDFFEQNAGTLSPEDAHHITIELLKGLNEIHFLGYAHRDIKPDNIMITKDKKIKYIDFGFACIKTCETNNCNNECKGRVGGPYYRPPEFFNGQHEESLFASQKHDVWSLGIVLFEMANGWESFPFDDTYYLKYNNIIYLFRSIANAPITKSNYTLDNGELNMIVDSLLINDWKNRPCAVGALDMAYTVLNYH